MWTSVYWSNYSQIAAIYRRLQTSRTFATIRPRLVQRIEHHAFASIAGDLLEKFRLLAEQFLGDATALQSEIDRGVVNAEEDKTTLGTLKSQLKKLKETLTDEKDTETDRKVRAARASKLTQPTVLDDALKNSSDGATKIGQLQGRGSDIRKQIALLEGRQATLLTFIDERKEVLTMVRHEFREALKQLTETDLFQAIQNIRWRTTVRAYDTSANAPLERGRSIVDILASSPSFESSLSSMPIPARKHPLSILLGIRLNSCLQPTEAPAAFRVCIFDEYHSLRTLLAPLVETEVENETFILLCDSSATMSPRGLIHLRLRSQVVVYSQPQYQDMLLESCRECSVEPDIKLISCLDSDFGNVLFAFLEPVCQVVESKEHFEELVDRAFYSVPFNEEGEHYDLFGPMDRFIGLAQRMQHADLPLAEFRVHLTEMGSLPMPSFLLSRILCLIPTNDPAFQAELFDLLEQLKIHQSLSESAKAIQHLLVRSEQSCADLISTHRKTVVVHTFLKRLSIAVKILFSVGLRSFDHDIETAVLLGQKLFQAVDQVFGGPGKLLSFQEGTVVILGFSKLEELSQVITEIFQVAGEQSSWEGIMGDSIDQLKKFCSDQEKPADSPSSDQSVYSFSDEKEAMLDSLEELRRRAQHMFQPSPTILRNLNQLRQKLEEASSKDKLDQLRGVVAGLKRDLDHHEQLCKDLDPISQIRRKRIPAPDSLTKELNRLLKTSTSESNSLSRRVKLCLLQLNRDRNVSKLGQLSSTFQFTIFSALWLSGLKLARLLPLLSNETDKVVAHDVLDDCKHIVRIVSADLLSKLEDEFAATNLTQFIKVFSLAYLDWKLGFLLDMRPATQPAESNIFDYRQLFDFENKNFRFNTKKTRECPLRSLLTRIRQLRTRKDVLSAFVDSSIFTFRSLAHAKSREALSPFCIQPPLLRASDLIGFFGSQQTSLFLEVERLHLLVDESLENGHDQQKDGFFISSPPFETPSKLRTFHSLSFDTLSHTSGKPLFPSETIHEILTAFWEALNGFFPIVLS